MAYIDERIELFEGGGRRRGAQGAEEEIWEAAQRLLHQNGRSGGTLVRNKHDALLKGLLYCGACNCSMTHSVSKSHDKHYRYYVCTHAMKAGWDTCPTKSLPAAEIENFVVNQIRGIGRDPVLAAKTVELALQQHADRITALQEERRQLEADLQRRLLDQRDLVRDSARIGVGESLVAAQLVGVQEGMDAAERRLREIDEDLLRVEEDRLDESVLQAAGQSFNPLWDALTGREKSRLLHLLIQRISYDIHKSTLAISYRPSGIRGLTAPQEANP